jgi:predicted GNAT family acetyltransferase
VERNDRRDDGDLSVTVRLNEPHSRYEGRVGEVMVGEIDFSMRASTMVITHTGTKPAWRGRGVAGQMTAFALADIRRRGLRLVPACPYTADFVRTHPEYADVLA